MIGSAQRPSADEDQCPISLREAPLPRVVSQDLPVVPSPPPPSCQGGLGWVLANRQSHNPRPQRLLSRQAAHPRPASGSRPGTLTREGRALRGPPAPPTGGPAGCKSRHPTSPATDSLLASSCFSLPGRSPAALGSTSSQVSSPPLSAAPELLLCARGRRPHQGQGTHKHHLAFGGGPRPVGPLRPQEVWVLEGPPHV